MKIEFEGKCICCSYPEEKTIMFNVCNDRTVIVGINDQEIIIDQNDILRLAKLIEAYQ